MIVWYTAYWLLFASLLILASHLLWRHGNEVSLRHRFRQAGQKLRALQVVSLITLSLLFLGSGGYIYYNRHVLNKYRSQDDQKKMQAVYEQRFGKYQRDPQPVTTKAGLKIDLFPEHRQAFLEGGYLLVNRTQSIIPEIYVNLPDRFITRINRLDFDPPVQLSSGPEEFGFRIFKLQRPLQPGDTSVLDFALEAKAEGFTDNNPKDEIAANGSCIIFSGAGGNDEFFPRHRFQQGPHTD